MNYLESRVSNGRSVRTFLRIMQGFVGQTLVRSIRVRFYFVQNVLAKALYDNVAESPDELSFRKGDILTVLEHNTQGLDGWWLCSLHGRQGIVPGNRLKILVGVHDKKQAALEQGTHQLQQLLPQQAPSAYQQSVICSVQPDSLQYAPTHPAFPAHEEDNIYLVPSKKIEVTDLYQVPQRAQSPPAKNPTLYDKPVPHYLLQRNVQETYQVPLPLNPAQELCQVPVPATKLAHDIHEVSPSYGIGPDIEQAPLSEAELQGIYHVPQPMDKGNWDKTRPPEKVLNNPPTVMMGCRSSNRSEEIYDVPPSFENVSLQPHLSIYNIPSMSKSNSGCSAREDMYDTPPRKQEWPLFLQCMYDIPRGASGGEPLPQDRDSKVMEEFTDNIKRLSVSSTGTTTYNIPPSLQEIVLVKETSVGPARPRMLELDLDLDVAMAMLANFQHSVATSVSHLMSFVSGAWRSPEQMGAHLQDIQTAIVGVQNSVRELLEFAQGAVGNSTKAADRTLYTKLSKQFQKMEDVYQTLLKHSQALDSCNWSLNILVAHKPHSVDDLDHFIMHARGIPDDTKQLVSFIRGNASLLFKKTNSKSVCVDFQTGLWDAGELINETLSIHQIGNWEKPNIQSRPLPLPPKFVAGESPDGCSENNRVEMMEDYDYVHLQVTGEFHKTEKELLGKEKNKGQSKEELDQEPMKQCKWLAIGNDHLNASDKKLLHFYLEQCETNVTTLTNAIDAFFTSVFSNQPPKIFVANSKFVILSAHKLVFIGDTLSRQAKAQGIRSEFTHYSNLLCDMLKEIVNATKMAAIQYPSPSAAKDMVDCVKELGRGTHQFQVVLGHLATM
ncbi:breast cancer anti-estrogen resistance protein 1 isoform X1 [Pleurodeles waltl]|uniref:breast cancer anti-estrogen resistance protein 1 isoform X1 n=2 Tax=Pleurodeles waltl TaxID=8319 RepID=UPI0037098F8B